MRSVAATICTLLVLAAPVVAGDLTDEELVARALSVSPGYTVPVMQSDGTPVRLFFDYNNDGRRDVAMLTVADEAGVSHSLRSLANRSRLFDRSAKSPLFIVETYFQGDEAVQTVEIGRYPVFRSMHHLAVSPLSAYPVAVWVETEEPGQITSELLLYDGTGMVSRLRAFTNSTQQTLIDDVDDDGMIDLVVINRLPEAGRGYETFIEFYALGELPVTRRGSFPVVRELNRFLTRVAEMMVAGQWDEIVDQVLPTRSSDSWEVVGDVFAEVIEDDLVSPEMKGFDYPATGTPIASVVFPAYQESPFPDPPLGGAVRVVLKVSDASGATRYFTGLVRLSDTPFTGPRFAFLTDRFGGQ